MNTIGYRLVSSICISLLLYLRKSHKDYDLVFLSPLDWIGVCIIGEGVYEKGEITAALNGLSANVFEHTCLDIGANIGNHGLQFSQKFKMVRCFEPNPEIFALLKCNTRGNKNMHLIDYGLSNEESNTAIYYNRYNLGAGSVEKDGHKNEVGEIRLKKFDDTGLNDSISFVKIDVEGSELNVIKGMNTAILKYKPVIWFEYIKSNDSFEIITKLKSLGYTCFYELDETSPVRRRLPATNWFFRAIRYCSKILSKPDYRLKKLCTPTKEFYNMILAEHPDSEFRILPRT